MTKKSGLPSRPRFAVDTVDGAKNCYEADHDIFLDVEEQDTIGAVCNDPKHCVAAQCATRRFGAEAVDFHRTVAYIAWPRGKGPYKKLPHEYLVRYTMPVDTMKLVAEFDKTGEFEVCTLILQAVTPGRTLLYRRAQVAKSRAKATGKTIRSKNTAGPRGGHHYVTGFISSVMP